MKTEREVAEGAVLVVAPIGKDAALAAGVLEQVGIGCRICANLAEAAERVESGTNAIVVEEEALVASEVPQLLSTLAKQPPWSDIPLIILSSAVTGANVSARAAETFAPQTNVTFLERPLGTVTLISAVRAALRARRRQYQTRDLLEQREAVLTGISDAFAALDNEWRYVYVNDTSARYAGMRREEMIGRNIWEIYPEAIGGNFYKHAHLAVETQRPQSFEQYYDRWQCWLETRIYPAAGGVVVFRANINERKQQEELMREAERKLQENETLLRLALEAADAGTFDYYPRSGDFRLGPRGKELVGLAPDAQVTQEEFLQLIHPADRERLAAEFRQALTEAGGRLVTEFRIRRHRDNEERWLVARGRARVSADGSSPRCIGTLLDITERKKTELMLERAKVAAEEANRAKDQFLAVLSHELRTPLTPVLMTLAALRRAPGLDDSVRADIETMQRNVELEALLIDDLLDLTRSIHGKLKLNHDAADIHALLEHAIAISASDLETKKLRVTRDLAAAEHHCWADAARLQQVFWNLIKNAVKFTPEGGEVHVSTRNDTAHQIVVAIRDTGIGIEPALLPRIFDPFEQGARAITSSSGGLGLGLAIAKNIIDLHHGTIAAQSAGTDKGAVFIVTLQAIATSLLNGPAYSLDQRQSAASPSRILLVEDHVDTARVLQRMLQHTGYEVESAHSVARARELIARQHFDLLISDLGLPDGSGLELMQDVRRTKPLPAIALSGFGTEEDAAASRAVGFAEHLTKPIEWERLRSALERVLHATRRPAEERLSA